VAGTGILCEVWEAALEGSGQTVYESPQRAAMMSRLLREGAIEVRGQRVTMASLRPRLQAHAEQVWPRLREIFGESVGILEDGFAQAEGYRLFWKTGRC
jgi:hypothetical protein